MRKYGRIEFLLALGREYRYLGERRLGGKWTVNIWIPIYSSHNDILRELAKEGLIRYRYIGESANATSEFEAQLTKKGFKELENELALRALAK
jgi:hypothetical protein